MAIGASSGGFDIHRCDRNPPILLEPSFVNETIDPVLPAPSIRLLVPLAEEGARGARRHRHVPPTLSTETLRATGGRELWLRLAFPRIHSLCKAHTGERS